MDGFAPGWLKRTDTIHDLIYNARGKILASLMELQDSVQCNFFFLLDASYFITKQNIKKAINVWSAQL